MRTALLNIKAEIASILAGASCSSRSATTVASTTTSIQALITIRVDGDAIIRPLIRDPPVGSDSTNPMNRAPSTSRLSPYSGWKRELSLASLNLHPMIWRRRSAARSGMSVEVAHSRTRARAILAESDDSMMSGRLKSIPARRAATDWHHSER